MAGNRYGHNVVCDHTGGGRNMETNTPEWPNSKQTDLIIESKNGNLERVTKLLEEIKDTTISSREMALWWASAMGHHEIVKLILETGGCNNFNESLFASNLYGNKRGNIISAMILIEHGADYKRMYWSKLGLERPSSRDRAIGALKLAAVNQA